SLATLHLFSVILFQSFCLSVFTVHRHLHSFPTRRSSDLPSSTGTSTSVQYSPKAASICRSEIRRGYVRVLTSTHCSPSTIRGSRLPISPLRLRRMSTALSSLIPPKQPPSRCLPV